MHNMYMYSDYCFFAVHFANLPFVGLNLCRLPKIDFAYFIWQNSSTCEIHSSGNLYCMLLGTW